MSEGPAPQLVTPQEAAQLFGATLSYVYRLASLYQWRRIKLGNRVYYDLADIDLILGKD